MPMTESEGASERPLHPLRVLIEKRLRHAVYNAMICYAAAACFIVSIVLVYEWLGLNIGIIAFLSLMVITRGGGLLVAE